MVIFGRWNGYTLTVSPKPNSLTISLQGSGSSRVLSFDAEGRLWTAMLAEISYRRGLNGRMVAKWQTSGLGRERRWLTGEETTNLEETARTIAASLLEDLQAGRVVLQTSLPASALPLLERAACFTQAQYRADVLRYQQVYQPVGILPPDQYMAVVLQATEGCSFNTCTFCNFYRGRRFRIKTGEEFHQHAEAVKDYLGRGLSLRRTIFLGDANALVTPTPRLLELLRITNAVYDVEALGGVYAFLDGFSGEKKSVDDYRALARLGLKRVYVGLESGSADLLRLLKKPGDPQDALQAVRTMKAAGVAVGVIVLLGAGGRQYAPAHIAETTALLNQMRLDMDDLLYFSELIESEGLEYTQQAYQHGLQPLSAEERIEQGESIERGLRFSARRGEPHISRYDIREFVY